MLQNAPPAVLLRGSGAFWVVLKIRLRARRGFASEAKLIHRTELLVIDLGFYDHKPSKKVTVDPKIDCSIPGNVISDKGVPGDLFTAVEA